jgi:hypothetical protein
MLFSQTLLRFPALIKICHSFQSATFTLNEADSTPSAAISAAWDSNVGGSLSMQNKRRRFSANSAACIFFIASHT